MEEQKQMQKASDLVHDFIYGFLELKNYAKADQLLDIELEEHPMDPELWILKALALQGLEQDEAALEALSKARENKSLCRSVSQQLLIYLLESQIYLKAEKFIKLQSLSRTLSKEYPQEYLGPHLALQAEMEKGNYEKARMLSDQAREEFKESYAYLNDRLALLLKLEATPEIKQEVSELIHRLAEEFGDPKAGRVLLKEYIARQDLEKFFGLFAYLVACCRDIITSYDLYLSLLMVSLPTAARTKDKKLKKSLETGLKDCMNFFEKYLDEEQMKPLYELKEQIEAI